MIHRPMEQTFVLDAAGRQLYLFVCRNGDEESGPPDLNCSGALDCRRMEARGGEREENLPVETHDVADYPEYGRLRHFRLRGMSVTLSFEEARFKAVGDIAESSGYLDPHRKGADRSCAVVRKGDEWKSPSP